MPKMRIIRAAGVKGTKITPRTEKPKEPTELDVIIKIDYYAEGDFIVKDIIPPIDTIDLEDQHTILVVAQALIEEALAGR